MDYILSFTSASLLVTDSIKVAKTYSKFKEWTLTEKFIINENLLQRKKANTILREMREIKNRLETLTKDQFDLLLHSGNETQKLLLFLSVCKYYSFIKEFTVEVLRQKVLVFDNQIYNLDYERFFSQKSANSEKLNKITESTRNKIKQVLFKILWQAGLIDSVKTKIITVPFLSEELVKVVVEENPENLKIFLVSDSDINNFIKKYGKS